MNLIKSASLLALALGASNALANNPLIVHEWGTFTSFFGSDGQRIEGMHHEDEPLPNFVYGYNNLSPAGALASHLRNFIDDCPPVSKVPCQFFERPRQSLPHNPINVGVTQKMETPVLYFYGAEGTEVDVKVDFPQGIHSQFYPRPSSFFPAVDAVKELGPSQIHYQLTLMSPSADGLPNTPEDSIWNPAREVPLANVIDVNGEREKFIFYRGVGDFDGSLSISSQRGQKVQLTNHSDKAHAAVFMIHVEGQKGSIEALTPQTGTQSIAIPEPNLSMQEYLPKAKSMVAQELIKVGLYQEEAHALVNTWEKSYFQQQGPRVLYILHRQDVERILPIQVTPRPQELERVLVGRLEFLSKQQERKLLIELVDGSLNLQGDRFAEPKLRRLEVLVQESAQLDAQKKAQLQMDIANKIRDVRQIR